MAWTIDPAWVGFGGTAISAFFASSAYLWKARQERKKTVRRALFHLLEFHHLASRVKGAVASLPSLFLERFESELRKRGMTLSDADRAQLSNQLPVQMSAVVAHITSALSQPLKEPYLKALDELSKDRPFLAYQLKGAEFVSMTELISSSVADMDTPESSSAVSTDVALHAICDQVQGDIVDDLARRCRMAAFSCSPWTYIRVRLHLRRQVRVNSAAEIERFIAQLFDGPITQVLTQPSTASTTST